MRKAHRSTPRTEFYLGLDFGGRQDFTTLVGLTRTQYWDFEDVDVFGRPSRKHRPDAFHVNILHRYKLNTDNVDAVVPDVHRRVAALRADHPGGIITLAADFTGAGADPVKELIRTNPDPYTEIKPVWFSGGAQEHRRQQEGDTAFAFWTVPRIDFLNIGHRGMMVGLGEQGDRTPVKLAKSLSLDPLAETLVREMRNVDPRLPTNARLDDTLAAWRENEHDDLVFAFAMACWAADKGFAWPFVVQNFVK